MDQPETGRTPATTSCVPEVRHRARTLSNPQLARLATEVLDLGARLDSAGPAPELDAARTYQRLACEAYARRAVDEGWHFAYRAAEALVETMDVAVMTAEARDLAAEVRSPGKFKKWRAAAICGHLAIVLDAGQPDERRRTALQAALRVRHSEYENVYRRLAILRRHQAILLIVGLPPLAFVILALVVQPAWPWEVVAAASIGVVGAVVSAAQRSTRLAGDRIPTQLNSAVASLSRIPVGAVAGLTVWLAATATDGPSRNPYYVLISAFAAGFAERLVTPKAGGTDGSGTTSS